MTTGETVVVETSARLHFGVLSLRETDSRWFGGLGAAAPGPTLRVALRSADTIEVRGERAERAEMFARRFLDAYGIDGGAAIHVQRALPAHSGLGSGTQLGLAIASGLAALHGVTATPAELARAIGRARRSAVGTWTFADGGLVVEGGHRRGVEGPGPLLMRVPFPPHWHGVVVVPEGQSGMAGEREAAAFSNLRLPPLAETHEVAWDPLESTCRHASLSIL